MALGGNQHRGAVVYPNPDDRNQKNVNALLVDAIKTVVARLDALKAEQRLADLETKVAHHEDFING